VRLYIKRIERKKLKSRRKNYSAYYLTATAAALLILAVLSVTVFFKTKSLSIEGSSIYDAAEIAKATGIDAGESLLLLNRAGIKQNLLNSFIYVDDVDVKLKFPSSVTVNITPSVAAASIETDSGWLLITKSGKTLEEATEPKPGTVIIKGAGADGIIPGTVFDLEDDSRERLTLSLAERGLGILSDKLSWVDIADEANVTFLYDNRLEINIGTYSDMDYKVKFIQDVIKNKVGPNTSGRITYLPDGSLQFLDKNSIEQNEIIYEQNLATYVETSGTETSLRAASTEIG
jgi:cell division protein FtsQ